MNGRADSAFVREDLDNAPKAAAAAAGAAKQTPASTAPPKPSTTAPTTAAPAGAANQAPSSAAAAPASTEAQQPAETPEERKARLVEELEKRKARAARWGTATGEAEAKLERAIKFGIDAESDGALKTLDSGLKAGHGKGAAKNTASAAPAPAAKSTPVKEPETVSLSLMQDISQC